MCVGGRGGISGHQSPEVYLFDQRQTSDVMEGGLVGGVGAGGLNPGLRSYRVASPPLLKEA